MAKYPKKEQQAKPFIVINESFTCRNCTEKNPPLQGSCRNHCRKCLFSLHVDKKSPGDRESNCKNLMKPVSLDKNSKKGWIISHKCIKCGKVIANKTAEDDDFDAIIKLSNTHP